MAITIEMPPIEVAGHTIEGGWKLKVPEIAIKVEDYERRAHWINSHGYTQADFKQGCQELFNVEYRARVVRQIKRWALRYMTIHPGIGLAGFKPERLQGAYVPGRVTPGPKGDSELVATLVEMGRDDSSS